MTRELSLLLSWPREQRHFPIITPSSSIRSRFSRGSLTMYTSPDMSEASLEVKTLQIGESVTVPRGKPHKFLVGEEETTTTSTFEPGSLDFRACYVDHARDTKRRHLPGIWQP